MAAASTNAAARSASTSRWTRTAPPRNQRRSGEVPNIVNLSIPGVEAESVIDAWKDLAAISDGAACTSATRAATSFPPCDFPRRNDGAVRFSWCHPPSA